LNVSILRFARERPRASTKQPEHSSVLIPVNVANGNMDATDWRSLLNQRRTDAR
jgi:hypothetical protein